MTRTYATAAVAVRGQAEHDVALTRLAEAVNTLHDRLVFERGDTIRFERLSHAVTVGPAADGRRQFHASALVHYSYEPGNGVTHEVAAAAADPEAPAAAGGMSVAQLRAEAVYQGIPVPDDASRDNPAQDRP